MKKSITNRITVAMIAMVVGTIAICWILNTTLLENYYVQTKQDTLEEVFERVEIAKEEIYNGKIDVDLEKSLVEDNITMMIMNTESQVLFSINSDTDKVRTQFLDILFRTENVGTKILFSTDTYKVGQYEDRRLSTEYLILWGNLQDGRFILMQMALESIRDSVLIANRFLAYIGIAAIVLSAFISLLVTRRITNPILQLVVISKKMIGLDFDAKFESRGETEIDLLGEHMNILSETLETAISELKTANNQLQEDIEKKIQIDEMRKEFLSNVSHELKTPLALIQGYAEGLKECINEDAQSREFYCDVIMDEANKMNRMVKQLLTLNQLEFGNEMVSMERFDLTELIRGVVQSAHILLEQNEIQAEFNENQPVYVWADEFKTEEVLTNFFSNAIHHAKGEKKIKVTVVKTKESVRVSVFNTGDPIPQQDLEHIWTKFYKVDKARTREYGGSGIGLSIVKAIMQSFHKPFGVINHMDGVEFWFELDGNCS